MQLSKIDRLFNTALSKPPIIYMNITMRCNAHCKQCWEITKNNVKELNTEQWKTVILKLRKWIGPFYLTISGGESLLREDLFEIIDFAHSKHIFTNIVTNGFLLSTRLEELNKSNLSRLTISLDGITAKTNDFLRGNGSFKKVTSAINALKKERRKDLIVTINSIMSRQNFHELPALVKFVQTNRIQGIFFNALRWRNFDKENGDTGFLNDPLWPKDYIKVKKILEKLIQLKNEGYHIINSIKYFQLAKKYFKDPNIIKSQNLTCLVPYECIVLNPQGGISLCSRPINNILEYDPSVIWKSKKVKHLKRKLLSCRRACMISCGRFEDTIASNLSKARIALFGKLKLF